MRESHSTYYDGRTGQRQIRLSRGIGDRVRGVVACSIAWLGSEQNVGGGAQKQQHALVVAAVCCLPMPRCAAAQLTWAGFEEVPCPPLSTTA